MLKLEIYLIYIDSPVAAKEWRRVQHKYKYDTLLDSFVSKHFSVGLLKTSTFAWAGSAGMGVIVSGGFFVQKQA